MSKKEILKKLKESLLVATAAVTGMTSSACDVKEYNVDNVGFDPGVHDTIDTKPETSTVETSYDSSVTTGPNDNLDSTVYTTLEDVDVPDDVVVTTVNESSIEEGTKEAVTTKINGTVPHGKTIQDGGSGVHRRTEAPKTQESQSKQSTKSTAKVTTAKPVTTKKVTAKTTPKTTVTTAQPTTTVTTTTTELVTEPPVTEPIERSYNIDDVCYNADAFEYYSDCLWRDILYRNGGMYRCNTFNGTDCFFETRMVFLMLNDGLISDEVVAKAFSDCELDDIAGCTFDYIMSIIDVEDYFGGFANFEEYACTSRKEVGREVNRMIQECRNGNFDQYVNNVNSNGLAHADNALEIAMLHSLDKNHSYNQYDEWNVLLNYIDPIGEKILSLKNSYHK